jgi:hypothetical protein
MSGEVEVAAGRECRVMKATSPAASARLSAGAKIIWRFSRRNRVTRLLTCAEDCHRPPPAPGPQVRIARPRQAPSPTPAALSPWLAVDSRARIIKTASSQDDGMRVAKTPHLWQRPIPSRKRPGLDELARGISNGCRGTLPSAAAERRGRDRRVVLGQPTPPTHKVTDFRQ